ncbi:hypothetical protein ASPACDRAFT_38548 [Aspergillus aculeatus ATCC 16872]|uniref:Uncharacterized protein n=1 Tax=Aspergillus aculeatus (strain ATCC 16872 / CBS 172.66 / WB 5094) TaxID=690307 RepID=A0A1L9X9F1_ASPA1|nr:uncharacterized protein ASPACDRAFT_38548 [Aspergillus aculeatus ATCC 16872]OJK04984.1 hypothetical protein ASPACDRAFT_38548 [Aspergillus aculeatus ATCC 16872]
MRTRSQMMSPGGFVSLDDHNVARPTRSTRSNSQQSAAAEEQPAPRPKATRAKKASSTTTKKARKKKASTKKRTTRQTTLKSGRSDSEETEQHQTEENENAEPTASQAEPSPPKNGSTEVGQNSNPADSESLPNNTQSPPARELPQTSRGPSAASEASTSPDPHLFERSRTMSAGFGSSEAVTVPGDLPEEPAAMVPMDLQSDEVPSVPFVGSLGGAEGEIEMRGTGSVSFAKLELEPLPPAGSTFPPVGAGPRSMNQRRAVDVLSPVPEHLGLGESNGLATDKKRRRPTNEDDNDRNDGEPTTPAANKRRNLGIPGSTPFSHASPLPRRVTANITPFSERLRRRNAESHGRIYRTSLRISQYLAQEDADRLASEKTPVPGEDISITEPFPSFEDNELLQEGEAQEPETESEPTQQPSTPDRPASSWRIRGLLNSVPRRLSRLIPTFGRTPERNEIQVTAEPTTEPLNRTQPRAIVPSNRTVSPTPKTKGPTQQPQRDLSFSLFPATIDRSRYLDDKPKATPKSVQQTTAEAPSKAPESSADTANPKDSVESTADASITRGRSPAQGESSISTPSQKKRKRAPSPDVIPNPPGCSYGMYEDYFVISDDEEDEEPAPPQTEPKKQDVKGKSAIRSVLRSERPASKKVRFDASPQDTPSKLRMKPRATDPYTGQHFIGMDLTGESSNSSSPLPPTHASQAEQSTVYPDPRSRPSFVPNREGTFETPYSDTSSDVSEEDTPAPGFVPNRDGTFETPYSDTSSEASDDEATPGFVPNRAGTFETPYSDPPSEPSASTPESVPDSQTISPIEAPSQHHITESTSSEETRATPQQALVPPTTPAKVEDDALARVRSQAEKYKPKTPSGLRTASRYSSPLTLATTPDTVSVPIATPSTVPVPAASPERASSPEDFGDDQFARDAQWLYENCPTGDLSELVWPEAENYEDMGFSAEAVRIANEMWDSSVVDHAYDNIWTPGLEAFRREMETGFSHAALA